MSLPRIGITLGDPGGIGPEIVLKALRTTDSLPRAEYILFGDSPVIEKEKKNLGIAMDLLPWDGSEGKSRAEPTGSSPVFLREVRSPLKTVNRGLPSKENGLASFLYFREALKEAGKGVLRALVTAPVSKHSWGLAGLRWRGHTDCLDHLYPGAMMTFWSESMTVALFSHHLPLKEALNKVKRDNLLAFFIRLHELLERIKPRKYEFLVAGLNPHAGEEGLLGSEEIGEILPAVREAGKLGMRIDGPYPADVVFRLAMSRPDTVVIALYHDQGLIAFKLAAFETGVNVTLGLPFIRTSPDHGTAFDIAGKGIADHRSMVEAIKLASDLSPASF